MKKLFIAILIVLGGTTTAQNFFWADWETNNLMNLSYEGNKIEAQKARELGYFVLYGSPKKNVEVVKDTTYKEYDLLRERTIKFSYQGYNFLITYQMEPIYDVISLFPKDCLTILYVKGGVQKKFCDYYLDGSVNEYYNNKHIAQKEYEEILGIALRYLKE